MSHKPYRNQYHNPYRKHLILCLCALLCAPSLSLAGAATTAALSNTSTKATPSRTHYSKLLPALKRAAPAANPQVIQLALGALDCALSHGMTRARNLTLIDYSLSANLPRLWVFDLSSGKLLFQELVAHGKNSGETYAQDFSNTNGSLQSSLGLFKTAETYKGAHGYSLRMDGLEEGFNDLARERAIVFHGAPYVNTEHIRKHGRLGRSWGCPAVSNGVARKVIDTIKGEQFLFSYYPDQQWLSNSKFLNCAAQVQIASATSPSRTTPSRTNR